MARVMDGLHQRLPHQRCSSNYTIQAGVLHHFDDGGQAPALLADGLCPGIVKLDFGGRIGSIAQLLLEPLDMKPVALAVRSPARQQKTGESSRRLREH